MNVLRAETMGMCFGVRDALQIARSVNAPQNVTIHGELVHNEVVLVELQTRGYRITPEDRRHALPETADVLVTAHGISDRERRRLEAAGKTLIDTTCPLVRRVHRAAKSLSLAGYHVLVIGRADHVEVRGIVEDLVGYDVISNADDVQSWQHQRLGIVCQTTTPPRLVETLRAAIRERNPHAETRFIDTVCQPTRDRQTAVERLCREVDLVIVVGGTHSNNTRQLVELCHARGTPARQVQSAADLDPMWFENCRTVGLTAGTSTLDETVQEVYDALRALPASPNRPRAVGADASATATQ